MTYFLDNSLWTQRFGDIKTQTIECWGVVTSLRVIYVDGCEIEFGITPSNWADIPIDEGTYKIVVDGMMILDDKKGILKKLKDAVAIKKIVL